MSSNLSVAPVASRAVDNREAIRTRHDRSVIEAAARSAVPLGSSMPVTRSTRSRSFPPRASRSSAANPDFAEDETLPIRQPKRKRSRATLKDPPQRTTSSSDDEKKPEALEDCCICMCSIERDQSAKINGCDHKFHFSCIEEWSKRENSCPLCKNRFTQIDRLNKKRKKGHRNVRRVRQRDQQADMSAGSALEGLLANFASRQGNQNIARLIFSTAPTFGMPPFRTAGQFQVARAAGPFEHLEMASDDESFQLSDFVRALHGTNPRPMTLNAAVAARSYASNSNDASAGVHAGNPLQIEDSDDDDEDVVEVVGVVTSVANSSR